MDYLQHLLNKVNRVTANHRHGNPVTKKDLDALSMAQIEYNESCEKEQQQKIVTKESIEYERKHP